MVNSKLISDLRNDVAINCKEFIFLCKEQGLNVLITQTLRDNEYQAKLYAQGRTEPGSIVTNSATVSFHGKPGLAFDFCKNLKGHEYDDDSFFARCGAIGKSLGFSWGGDWKSFPDRPHFQWDEHGKYTSAMIRSGKYPGAMPEPGSTGKKEEEETMDISKLTDKECYEIMTKAQNHAATLPGSAWAKEAWESSKASGITDGKAPKRLATKEEIILLIQRSK